MKQRRGIRSPWKVVIRAGIFLLLVAGGAIVNIAVAWTIAAFRQVEPYQDVVFDDDADDLWHCCRPTDWPDEPDRGARYRGVGWNDRWSIREGRGAYDGGHLVEERSAGLPFVALRCIVWSRQIDTYCHIYRVDWGWRPAWNSTTISESMVVMGEVDDLTVMPLRSLWPGFAINTLFYAAILWLLFALPAALRRMRRIKRGLCPACAYPVGTSPVCTECGKPLSACRSAPTV